MLNNYTAQTFVAWWIGASVGFIVAVLTVGEGRWTSLCTLTAVYTVVLLAIYGLGTRRGDGWLSAVKRSAERKD